MRTYRVVVTGLGNIGANLLDLLHTNAGDLQRRYGVAVQVVGAADSSGALYNPDGFDLGAIVSLKRRGGKLEALASSYHPLLSARDVVENADADVLLEATPTNLTDGQPGLDLVRAALRRGQHAILASKGPLVLAYQELTALAATHGGTLAFSGAVCGALPTVNVGRRDLAGGHVLRLEAVLNGTTQVILLRMAAGVSYADALAEAQRLGIAEPDPSLDVDGWDAANKLVIIANAVLDQPTTLADVAVTGIRGVDPVELREVAASGEQVVLLAVAERTGATYDLSVHPTVLPADHPLARLGLDEMGVVYYTDIYGRLALTSADQGPQGASAAMLRDLLDIAARGG